MILSKSYKIVRLLLGKKKEKKGNDLLNYEQLILSRQSMIFVRDLQCSPLEIKFLFDWLSQLNWVSSFSFSCNFSFCHSWNLNQFGGWCLQIWSILLCFLFLVCYSQRLTSLIYLVCADAFFVLFFHHSFFHLFIHWVVTSELLTVEMVLFMVQFLLQSLLPAIQSLVLSVN